jgi:hypothetical protein
MRYTADGIMFFGNATYHQRPVNKIRLFLNTDKLSFEYPGTLKLVIYKHSTQHTRHSQGKPNHIFTYLFVYLFAFYIYSMFFHIYNLKNTFYYRHAAIAPHKL